jgi:hypothetical protein
MGQVDITSMGQNRTEQISKKKPRCTQKPDLVQDNMKI